MGRGGRREDEDCNYLCVPFKFIHNILRSFLAKFHGLRTPPHNFPISQEEEDTEAVEVEVSSRKVVVARQNKQNTSSGKPGGINKGPS